MAARERVGLSGAQVDRLRDQLAEGRAPRVRVSGPQFADQPTGTVLAVGRPETDGDEFVTVRVKAGGVTDELRFSPRELAAVTRGPAARASAPAKKSTPAKRAGSGEDAAVGRKAQPPQPPPSSQPPQSPSRPGKAAAAGSNRRRGAALPAVSVTLASSGATWSVSAQRGARTVVKNAPVPPGVVSAVAELLGQPVIGEAIAAVNEAALREAESRAAALRAELAALEAELNSHRRP